MKPNCTGKPKSGTTVANIPVAENASAELGPILETRKLPS